MRPGSRAHIPFEKDGDNAVGVFVFCRTDDASCPIRGPVVNDENFVYKIGPAQIEEQGIDTLSDVCFGIPG